MTTHINRVRFIGELGKSRPMVYGKTLAITAIHDMKVSISLYGDDAEGR